MATVEKPTTSPDACLAAIVALNRLLAAGWAVKVWRTPGKRPEFTAVATRGGIRREQETVEDESAAKALPFLAEACGLHPAVFGSDEE